jgi:hypothetical protein
MLCPVAAGGFNCPAPAGGVMAVILFSAGLLAAGAGAAAALFPALLVAGALFAGALLAAGALFAVGAALFTLPPRAVLLLRLVAAFLLGADLVTAPVPA